MILEEFSEAEFQKALQRIIWVLTRGKAIPDQPKAILLGGQSGAGNTTIHGIKQKEFQGNIIIIDGDSYRSQHPNYLALQEKYGKDSVDYSKGFAGKMVEYLVDELSTQGYQVSLAIIGTKPKLSYLSTLIRYEELYAINLAQSRATPKEHHDYIVEHLVDNLRELKREQLFDQIQIYQRDRTYPWC